jgi:tape measure domain-containing protein
MALPASITINLKDRFSSVSRNIESRVQSLQGKLKNLGGSLDKVGSKFRSVGGNLSAWVSLPIAGIGAAALKSAADMESLEVQLGTMLRSSEKGKAALKDLVDFTARTPFQLEGVSKAAKTLLSFGMESDTIKDRLKSIGDVAAGSGQNISELAVIFGQVSAAGKLTGERFLQLQERAVPIGKALSEKLGVPIKAIPKLISKGRISFKDFESAFVSLSQKGGIFENAMDKLSLTLGGLFSTLKDNVKIAFAELGLFLVESFNLKQVADSLIKSIQSLTSRFVNFAKENPRLAKAIVIVTAAVAILGPALVALGAAIGIVSFSMTGLAAVAAVVFSPITGIVVAVGALTVALGYAWSKADAFRDMLSDVADIVKLLGRLVIILAGKAFRWLADILSPVTEYLSPVGDAFGYIGDKISGLLGYIGKLKSAVTDRVLKVFNFIFGDKTRENIKQNLSDLNTALSPSQLQNTADINLVKNSVQTNQAMINGAIDTNVTVKAEPGTSVKNVQTKTAGMARASGMNLAGAYQ